MVQELKKAKRSRMEVQDAIRLAAVTEFALHGLRGATTKSIAERAELSKAQLHYYIESKEALYIELLQLVVSEWSRESFQERDGDPAQMLASYVKRKLVFSFREPLLSKMFANELISGAKVLRSMLTDPRARANQVIDTLGKWIEDGKIRSLDPWLLLMHIWAVTQHYADFDVQVRFMMQVSTGQALDEARITREVVAFVLYGCGLVPTEADLAL